MMWFGFVLSLLTGIFRGKKMQKLFVQVITHWSDDLSWFAERNGYHPYKTIPSWIHAHTKNILAKHNKTFTYTLIKKGSGRATVAPGWLAIIDLQSLHSNSWITLLKSCNVSYEPEEQEKERAWETDRRWNLVYLALNTDISKLKLVVYESNENIRIYWTMPHIHEGLYLSWNK